MSKKKRTVSTDNATSPCDTDNAYFDCYDDESMLSATSQLGGALGTAQEKIEDISRAPVLRPIDFREYITRTFEGHIQPDLKIQIGNDLLSCRRSILQLYSPYVRQLRTPLNCLVLPPEKVTVEAMKIIFAWMCNPKYKLQRDRILEVYAAAQFLEIDSLIAHSWECITSPKNIEDRAFMLYLEAIYLVIPSVQNAMIARVHKFFLTLVGFVQYVELPFVHVCEMLASDSLGVNCELEVFFACVRYLNAHWEERKDRVFEMMRNVRFGLLPPHVLVSFRFKKETPEINRLLENEQVEKLLSETMHFSIGLGTPPSSSLLFKEREWIFDMFCEYHSTKSIPAKKTPLTYEKFLDYTRNLAGAETQWLCYERASDVELAAQLYQKN